MAVNSECEGVHLVGESRHEETAFCVGCKEGEAYRQDRVSEEVELVIHSFDLVE